MKNTVSLKFMAFLIRLTDHNGKLIQLKCPFRNVFGGDDLAAGELVLLMRATSEYDWRLEVTGGSYRREEVACFQTKNYFFNDDCVVVYAIHRGVYTRFMLSEKDVDFLE